MKILITYFSNTGNTEKIAIAMKDALTNHEVELVKAKDMESENLKYYDIVALGSGIYAGKINKSILDLIKKAGNLPPKFILFNTHASPEHYQHSFKRVKKIIDNAGAEVIGEWDCRGDNIGLPKEMIEQRLASLPPEERKKAETSQKDLKGRPNEEDLKNAKEFITSIVK
ncbi:MAG: flavodoxin family protein [Promethearchaeota archaeon]